MQTNIYEEAKKIWNGLIKNTQTPAEDRELEFEIHKRLLNFFSVGDYYYFVFNLATASVDYVSHGAKTLLGYELEEISVQFFLQHIHPEDQPYFLAFETMIGEFISKAAPEQIANYKARYDYRIKKKDGTYVRILQQTMIIQHDKDKNIYRSLGIHTDISEFKTIGKPVFSLIGMNGEPSFIDIDIRNRIGVENSPLSKREIQIVTLLMDGLDSKGISERLFISTHTVNTHRKNILQKTGCTNTMQLLSKAINHGWI